ncbi:MAG: hypothetical protein R2861_01170 [Desulfobacterales bacterium]
MKRPLWRASEADVKRAKWLDQLAEDTENVYVALILADTSIWIDAFKGKTPAHCFPNADFDP